MFRNLIIAGAVAGSLVSGPAVANDCQTVADAYDALSKVPAYRETVVLRGKLLGEYIAIGNTLYTKNDSGWKPIDLGPGGRAAMQKKVIPSAADLKDCSRVGPDVVAGKDAVIYTYTPPAIQGLDELGPQRVWIGTANGLPLRMTSEQAATDITLSFDNVTAPK